MLMSTMILVHMREEITIAAGFSSILVPMEMSTIILVLVCTTTLHYYYVREEITTPMTLAFVVSM